MSRHRALDLTDRRSFLTRCFGVTGLALGAGAVVAACGGDDDTSSSSSTPGSPASSPGGETSLASAPAGGSGFPLTIEHRFGTTTIPEKPQRVVTAGFNDADFALAVGVVPVGVANFIGAFPEEDRPWAQDALGGAQPEIVTSEAGELLAEIVAGLRPDVIIYYNYLEDDDYALLAEIAPTVVEPAPGTLWDQHTIDVGRALGYEAEARQLVDDVQARFASEQEAHPEFVGTTAALVFGVAEGDNYFLLEPTDARVGIFVSLGFEMPETTGEISKENADLLDQDLVVVIGTTQEVMEADPIFAALSAVTEGRVAYLGGFEEQFAGALGFDSPLSIPAALDVAVPELARALAAG